MSEDLTRRLGRNTVVVAGHPLGRASQGKIFEAIRLVCKAITDRIVAELGAAA